MSHHKVRILHLSDLHERGSRETEGWRRRRVLGDAWLAHLQDIQEDGPIDLVCFTGDAADWGREEEFARATDLFAETLRMLGLPWDRFFTVPGNHDIHQPTEKPLWKRLRPKIVSLPRLDASRWMNGQNLGRGLGKTERDRLLRRQTGYRQWLTSIGRSDLLPSPTDHPHLGYRQTLRLPGRPFDLHVIGLDSAWLCGDDNDSGKLLLTQDQIGRLCAAPDNPTLPGFRLVLVHHPLDDLADAAEARRLLGEKRVDLVLRGHLHEPELSLWEDPDRGLRQMAAGCLYEGHGADQYRNACTLVELHLDAEGRPLRYQLRFRGWSSSGFWFDDGSLYRKSRAGRLVWKVVPDSAETTLHPRVAEVFVGRVAEMARLEALLLSEAAETLPAPPVAICAVQGMPGVGKSYLADRFALEHAAAFPGGYLRLVLDPKSPRSADSLREELADRLDLPIGPALTERLRDRLRSPRTLLHVENVDSPWTETAATRLLQSLNGCAVIVTGRMADLGREAGWRQVRIDPFDEKTALQQLHQEIEQLPNAAEGEEHLLLISALGALPLAVHLAAGYLRAGGTAKGFLKRLRDQGLDVGPVHAAELAVETSEAARKILRTSFGISLGILEEELGARAPELIAGFHALGHAPLTGFGRNLGAALAGLSEDDFEELVIQARKLALLLPLSHTDRPDGAWRIHPLIAELLRLESPAQEAFERMTAWFVARLPKTGLGQEAEQGLRWREVHSEGLALAAWLPRVSAQDRVHVERAGSVYASRFGPYRLWAELCETALKGDLEDVDRSNFLWTLAQVSTRAGDLERSLRAAHEKIEVDLRRKDERETALAWGVIADILQQRGDLDEALRIRREEEIPVYEKIGDVRSRAVTIGKIADILQQRGDLDEALRIRREEQIPVYEKIGDVRSRAVTIGKIADILQQRGDLDEALRIRREEEIPVYEKIGDVRSRAVTLGKIADILQQRGDLDEALRIRREEQIPVYEKIGDVRSRAVTLGQIADILQQRGDLDEALRIRREEQIPVFEKIGDVRSRAVTIGKIADILQQRGDLDEALRIRREEQIPVYEKIGDVRSRAVTIGKIADILQQRGDLDEALRIRREEQIPVYEKIGDVRSRAVTLGQIADILQQRGDLDEALRIRREEQIPVFEKIGDVRERAVTLGQIADILQQRGDLDEALRIRREEQIPVFEKIGDVRERAVTLGQIADILQQRGDLDEALRIRREEQIPVFEKIGDVRERAVTLGQIADILQQRGDLDEALRIRREEQIPVFEKIGDVRERAVTLGQIADILQQRGDLDEALRIRREEEIPVYEKIGDVRERLVAWANLALLYLARAANGDRQSAEDLLCRALRDAERLRIPEAGQIRAILQRHGLREEAAQ